jgi:hypothetical protein
MQNRICIILFLYRKIVIKANIALNAGMNKIAQAGLISSTGKFNADSCESFSVNISVPICKIANGMNSMAIDNATITSK